MLSELCGACSDFRVETGESLRRAGKGPTDATRVLVDRRFNGQLEDGIRGVVDAFVGALARGHAVVALPAIGCLHLAVVGRLHLHLHLRIQLLILVVR